MSTPTDFDPKLDLVFERKTKMSVEQLWNGWTDPQTLMKWFCPKPWNVTDCRIDLRAGGEFYTLMEGPNGEKMPNNGSYLEVNPGNKLVWTNLMTKDFRPAKVDVMGFPFVAIISFAKTSEGVTLQAHLKHASEEARKQHEQMGFQEGWGMAFDQLADLMKG